MEREPLLKEKLGDCDEHKAGYRTCENNGYVQNDAENEDLTFEENEELLKFERKRQEIESFLCHAEKSNPKYHQTLRKFALSDGGFITDKIRKKVWPDIMLLEPDKYEMGPSEEEFRTHPEYTQVVLDVNRSLKRFPPGIPYEQRVAMQDQLIRLILRVIMKYPMLRYYQGYHDVAVTFLLVVGENVSFHIMEKLSTDHLKHFMEPTMEKTSQLLNYIYPLLERLHPQLCNYIERAEVGTMFCLPWFLTWYSHTLTRYEHVVRFYDYFLASPPLLPLYLIPQILVHRQHHIFNTECDMASLHQTLSQLPEDLPYETLLHKATELYKDYPPESVEKDAAERTKLRLAKLEEERIERQRNIRRSKRPSSKAKSGNIAQWPFASSRFRMFLVSASFAVGLYAYFRYVHHCDMQYFMPK